MFSEKVQQQLVASLQAARARKGYVRLRFRDSKEKGLYLELRIVTKGGRIVKPSFAN